MRPVDEGRHPPGEDPWWSEQWDFTFHDGEARLGGYASLVLLPASSVAWYWSALVRAGRPLVTLVDLEVPMPRRTLEIRSHGVWADHICEHPFRHWTIGNEATAIALDDPDEALGAARGDPTPLGFDLEWEATAAAVELAADRYEVSASVHGQVLVGSETIDVTVHGAWTHRWGVWDPFALQGVADLVDGLRAPVPIAVAGRTAALHRTLASDGWHDVLVP